MEVLVFRPIPPVLFNHDKLQSPSNNALKESTIPLLGMPPSTWHSEQMACSDWIFFLSDGELFIQQCSGNRRCYSRRVLRLQFFRDKDDRHPAELEKIRQEMIETSLLG